MAEAKGMENPAVNTGLETAHKGRSGVSPVPRAFTHSHKWYISFNYRN